MAVIASAAAGAWETGATWTGGVAPGLGDQVEIDHAVSLQSAVSVGTSPDGDNVTDWAVTIAPTASLTINAGGWLQARGPALAENTANQTTNLDAIVLNAGGRYQFDASQAADPAGTNYRLQIGTADWNRRRISGRGPGWLIDSDPAGGNGYIIGKSGYGMCADLEGVQGAPGVLRRVGTAALNAITHGANDSIYNVFRLQDVWLDECGGFKSHLVVPGAATYVLRRVTTTGTLTTSTGDVGCNALTTGTRAIEDCSFDRRFRISNGQGLPVSLSTFVGGVMADHLTSALCPTWDDNLLFLPKNTSGAPMGTLTSREYRIAARDESNAKMLNLYTTNAHTSDDSVWEPLGATGSDGEYVNVNTLTIANLIRGGVFLPHHDGESMRWGEILTDNAGRIDFEHCSGGAYTCTLGVGHPGHTVANNGVERLRKLSCIEYTFDPGSGTPRNKTGNVLNLVVDSIQPQYADYNCGHGLDAGQHGKGYDHELSPEMITAQGLPGQHDVDVDPWPDKPAGPTRRLSTWARDILGLVGTDAEVEDAALDAILVRHLPDHPDHIAGADHTGLYAYVREDWRPTNPLLADAGHDGVTIGAMEMAELPDVTGGGVLTLGALNASGAGTLAVAGGGAAVLGALTGAGTGALAIAASGTVNLGALTATGTGTVTDAEPDLVLSAAVITSPADGTTVAPDTVFSWSAAEWVEA